MSCRISTLVRFLLYVMQFFKHKNSVTDECTHCIGGKITTVPRLFSEHLLQDENKHQIMNVQTKWNCLIPILSGFVKY